MTSFLKGTFHNDLRLTIFGDVHSTKKKSIVWLTSLMRKKSDSGLWSYNERRNERTTVKYREKCTLKKGNQFGNL